MVRAAGSKPPRGAQSLEQRPHAPRALGGQNHRVPQANPPGTRVPVPRSCCWMGWWPPWPHRATAPSAAREPWQHPHPMPSPGPWGRGPAVPTHASLQSHRSPQSVVPESNRSHQHPARRSCLHLGTGGPRCLPMGPADQETARRCARAPGSHCLRTGGTCGAPPHAGVQPGSPSARLARGRASICRARSQQAGHVLGGTPAPPPRLCPLTRRCSMHGPP